MKPKIHILFDPKRPLNYSNKVDAFSTRTYKLIKYMEEYGWEVIPYLLPGSDTFTNTVICEGNYISSVLQELKKNKNPNDLLCCIWGTDHKPIADSFPDLKVIEPIVGYRVSAAFAPYKVFESYSNMHIYYGYSNKFLEAQWFDTVITPSVDLTEFDFSPIKEDYLLFIGRVIADKGIHVAIQAAIKTNNKLIVTGPGTLASCGYSTVPPNVVEVGISNPEQRRELLSKAKAILAPTYYSEPFGNVTIEALASGTPVITTDWGAFTETIQHGVTGFRCREFREFVQAIQDIDKLDNLACYHTAITKYSDSVIHKKFNEYFTKVADLNFYR